MDIIDLLRNSGVDFKMAGEDSHVSRKGEWVGLVCPWCNSSSYHLGINIVDGRCHCWKCGRHDLAQTLCMVCSISTKEASLVYGSLHRVKVQPSAHKGVLSIPPGVGPILEAHRSYLKGRGFDPYEIVELWGVKGIGICHRLSWRLFIPIYDEYGRMVSWTTRGLSNKEPRYVSASPDEESVPHKRLLYGAHLARNVIIVLEGPLDAWAVGAGAVATCGIGYTEEQVIMMAKWPLRVICFDSSFDAQRRAQELCRELKGYPGSTEMVELESGEDAASADKAEIQELRTKYLNWLQV